MSSTPSPGTPGTPASPTLAASPPTLAAAPPTLAAAPAPLLDLAAPPVPAGPVFAASPSARSLFVPPACARLVEAGGRRGVDASLGRHHRSLFRSAVAASRKP